MKRMLYMVGLGVVGLTTACSLNSEPPVTYVIVTSTPDQTIAVNVTALPPTATTTPLPTLTPTPDLPPDQTLSKADRYLLDGYFEEAVTTYDSVLSRGDASADQQAAAAFGKGRAALRAGLFDQAVAAFTVLITNHSADFRVPQGYFLRGDAYSGLANWTAAIPDYRQYLMLRPGIIDSYVHERVGDAQLGAGQYGDALTSYDLATQTTRTLEPALALREKVAQVHLSGGNLTAAIAQYDAILQIAKNAPYLAEIEFAAGQALLDSGDLANGLSRMQRVFNNYPATPQALEAMAILAQNGRNLDSYQQGRVYYFNEDYQNAMVAFNTYSSSVPLGDIPAEFYLLLGQSYRAVGNAPAALVAFDTIVKLYPTDPLLGEALLEQGRTHFLNGDTDSAIDFYLNIPNTYGYLIDASSEALWRAGYLYSTTERRSLGRQTFEALADRYPQTEQAVSGLNIAAAQALAAGDTPGAEVLYSRVAQLAKGDTQSEAFLQVGRLALQRGDHENANAAFDQAITAAPDSYFSARAADLRAGISPFQRPSQYRFEFDDVQQLAEAEDWLRQTFNIDQPSPLWVLSPELEADTHVIRGRELWMIGAFDAAEIEFLDILEKYQADALASYRLSLFMRGLGSYYPSMVGAANVIRAANVSTLQAPTYIARLRYPVYYRDVVLSAASQHNMDPLLLFTLIRNESLFDADATAAAGEKGLTQVIPSTAEYIAEQIHWTDYQHSDLFRPYAGIAFGAFFLDEQLDRFDGNVMAGLSAYNAGPGRAISWLELAGNNPDIFLSTITIESTRIYVQRFYSQYNIYRAIYGL